MIRLPEHKEPQNNPNSEKYLNPKELYLPLSQHTGAPSSLCVKKGDSVQEGQLLAKESGFISARLHAPSNGKIINIDDWFHPNLKRTPCIIIKTDSKVKDYPKRKNIDSLENEKIKEIIQNCGIVGMGGAAFPTHVKLNPPKKIDTLIINGCECEPYLTTDQRLMIENINEVFLGIEIISKLINPKKIIFAIEANKPNAIKKVNLIINTKKFNLPIAETVILKAVYPQGGEKQLIERVTKRKVPPKSLPLDVGCLVHNVATCFAIYEAIYLDRPLIQRLVSFCGDALHRPKNIWVKIGTTLKELFDEKVLEFKNEPKKVVSGGPMMGIALDNLEYPILKGTGGFLFLTNPPEVNENPCIRCARCVDACPMNLLPLNYVKLVKNQEYESLNRYYISDCIECGCCAYTCPAKIPLVHYIKIGKKYAPRNN